MSMNFKWILSLASSSLMFALLQFSATAHAGAFYKESWEDGVLYKPSLYVAGGCYNKKDHGYNSFEIVKTYARHGKRSLRAEAHGMDKNSVCSAKHRVKEEKTRNEIFYMADDLDLGRIPHGREIWLKTSYYVPSNEGTFNSWWNKGGRQRFIILQMNGAGNKSTPEVHFLLGPKGNVDIEMTHSVTVKEQMIKDHTRVKFASNSWNDVVIRWKRSWKNDGILQIWINGEMVVDKMGPTAIRDKPFGKFKTGIYFGEDKRPQEYVIYIDNFTLGDKNNTYESFAFDNGVQEASAPTVSPKPPKNISFEVDQ